MEWIELTITIIKAIFVQGVTPEIMVVALATFALLLWGSIGIVNLWDKRKKKLVNTPLSEQKEMK